VTTSSRAGCVRIPTSRRPTTPTCSPSRAHPADHPVQHCRGHRSRPRRRRAAI